MRYMNEIHHQFVQECVEKAIFGGLSPDLMKYCFKGIKIRYEME